MQVRYKPTGQLIAFRGLDKANKIKSIKFKLEYGTSKQKAKPYLRHAYDKHIGKIKTDMKNAIKLDSV